MAPRDPIQSVAAYSQSSLSGRSTMGTGIIFMKSDVGGYFKGGDTSIGDSRTSNIIEATSSIYSELAGQNEHSPWCEPISRSELVNILDFAGAQTVQVYVYKISV